MEDFDRKIAQLAEELKKLEQDMRRAGLAVTPDLARMRRWQLARSLGMLYQRWHDFLFVHFAHPAPDFRHARRAPAHAPRPD